MFDFNYVCALTLFGCHFPSLLLNLWKRLRGINDITFTEIVMLYAHTRCANDILNLAVIVNINRITRIEVAAFVLFDRKARRFHVLLELLLPLVCHFLCFFLSSRELELKTFPTARAYCKRSVRTSFDERIVSHAPVSATLTS